MYSISPTVPPRRNYKTTTPIPARRKNLPPPPPKVNETTCMLFIIQSVRGGFSMGLWAIASTFCQTFIYLFIFLLCYTTVKDTFTFKSNKITYTLLPFSGPRLVL